MLIDVNNMHPRSYIFNFFCVVSVQNVATINQGASETTEIEAILNLNMLEISHLWFNMDYEIKNRIHCIKK